MPEDQIIASTGKNHSEFSEPLLDEIGSDIFIIQPPDVVKEQESIHKSEALGVVVAEEDPGTPFNTRTFSLSFRMRNGLRIEVQFMIWLHGVNHSFLSIYSV